MLSPTQLIDRWKSPDAKDIIPYILEHFGSPSFLWQSRLLKFVGASEVPDGSDLRGFEFNQAQIMDRLAGYHFFDFASFVSCKIRNSIFDSSIFCYSTFKDTSVENGQFCSIEFVHSEIDLSNFTNIIWLQARFRYSNITKSTFTGVDFSTTVFHFCKFTNVHFVDCNFDDVKISESVFENVTFDRCVAKRANAYKSVLPTSNPFG